MKHDPFAPISAAQRHAVQQALAAVLGSATSPGIRPLTGGVSGAFVFLVEAAGRCFVLRIEGSASPLRNPHQYQSMRIAAEQGIAPKVHYLDENDRVVVMDFIVDRSLEAYPDGVPGLARAVGAMIRKLQSAPVFPVFVDYPDIVSRLWRHVCRTGLFADGVLDHASQQLARICSAYDPRAQDYVSSHNDVLPRNVLFDGSQIWLIDWESAYRNDPLVDVATALDNFAPSPEMEEMLLLAWLGREPDRPMRERLAQVRALTRLYYTGVLFSAAAEGPRAAPEASLSALSAAEFEQAIRERRLLPETPQASLALGKIFLNSFLTGEVPPGLPPMYMR
jgi:aminoglycoside phosphotransferase (APT) family kinase protein